MSKVIQKPDETARAKTRKSKLSELLNTIEEGFTGRATKATLADYIRLAQLEREMAEDEPLREIKVTWIEKRAKFDIEK